MSHKLFYDDDNHKNMQRQEDGQLGRRLSKKNQYNGRDANDSSDIRRARGEDDDLYRHQDDSHPAKRHSAKNRDQNYSDDTDEDVSRQAARFSPQKGSVDIRRASRDHDLHERQDDGQSARRSSTKNRDRDDDTDEEVSRQASLQNGRKELQRRASRDDDRQPANKSFSKNRDERDGDHTDEEMSRQSARLSLHKGSGDVRRASREEEQFEKRLSKKKRDPRDDNDSEEAVSHQAARSSLRDGSRDGDRRHSRQAASQLQAVPGDLRRVSRDDDLYVKDDGRQSTRRSQAAHSPQKSRKDDGHFKNGGCFESDEDGDSECESEGGTWRPVSEVYPKGIPLHAQNERSPGKEDAEHQGNGRASRSDGRASRSDGRANRSDGRASRSDGRASRSDGRASRSDGRPSAIGNCYEDEDGVSEVESEGGTWRPAKEVMQKLPQQRRSRCDDGDEHQRMSVSLTPRNSPRSGSRKSASVKSNRKKVILDPLEDQDDIDGLKWGFNDDGAYLRRLSDDLSNKYGLFAGDLLLEISRKNVRGMPRKQIEECWMDAQDDGDGLLTLVLEGKR